MEHNKDATFAELQELRDRVKAAESKAVQAEERAIQIERDLTSKLEEVTGEKLKADEHSQRLQTEVESQRQKIVELEAELDLLSSNQRQTPTMNMGMEMDCEQIYLSPVGNVNLLSPTVRSGQNTSSPLSVNQSGEKKHPIADTAKRADRIQTIFHEAMFRGLTWSPTTFVTQDTPSSQTSSTPRSFRWPLEYKSFINPVHIDESKAAEQSSSLFESVDDAKIQQVTNEFFRNCNFPSPHLTRTPRH